MKLNRAFLFMGMLGTATFILEDTLGTLLWKDYNPISMFVSQLTADGAPNLLITRSLYNAHNIFLMLFLIGMCSLAFRFWRPMLKIGYAFLLIALSMALVGIGSFPMSLENVFSAQNVLHFVFAVGMFAATVLVIYILAIGYQKEKGLMKVGNLSLIIAILFTIWNLLLLFVIMEGINIAGLMQRLSIYTFFLYVWFLSWFFFRRSKDAFN